ncbi:MAG: hypothetical protein OWS74_03835 [Firmicutes bacterium]|nr:hypothetical protein [Bacillota bacterium]
MMTTNTNEPIDQVKESLRPVPLTRGNVKGWIQWIFWGLRIYIVVMVVLVVIGFARGLH